jgi:hypothetical protein
MSSTNESDDNDGRTSARKKTLRTGTIVYNHRMSTMECAIFDLSDEGARLRPTDTGLLPDGFELQVLYGDTFQCKVIHKTRDQIGVRFV